MDRSLSRKASVSSTMVIFGTECGFIAGGLPCGHVGGADRAHTRVAETERDEDRPTGGVRPMAMKRCSSSECARSGTTRHRMFDLREGQAVLLRVGAIAVVPVEFHLETYIRMGVRPRLGVGAVRVSAQNPY